MKLIKKLNKDCGEFYCDFCLQIVERFLSNGKKTKSCGCKRNILIAEAFTIHGDFGTRLYNIWALIKQRCLNPKNKSYPYYGGRGITICDEWLAFIPFRDWALNNGYTDYLTIDRIENDLGYNPKNCQWITQKENNRKKKDTKLTQEISNEIRYLYKIGKYTQKELSIKYNVSVMAINDIVNNKTWRT